MNWSLHRHTDLICGLIVAATVALTVIFINSERLGVSKIISDGGADRGGSFSARDYDSSWSETSAIKIDLNDLTNLGHNGGAYVLNGDVHIVTAGSYVLSGSLDNQQVIVDAQDSKVQLVLNNVDLRHETLAPIWIKAADKVFVTLPDDTHNSIVAANLISPEASSAGVTAAIYAKADLAFNGDGSLSVTATGGHGIRSSDDLVITGGHYQITATRTTHLGKDSVRIATGEFDLRGGEGIKANNIAKADKGYIVINDGQFTLDVDGDGLQAETDLTLNGGHFTIMTGGGSAAASSHQETGPGAMRPEATTDTGDDKQARAFASPPSEDDNWENFTAMLASSGDRPPMPPEWGNLSPMENIDLQPNFSDFDQNLSNETRFEPPDLATRQRDVNYTDEDGEASAKCLKAGSSMAIMAGTLVLDCRDDALHSDGDLTLAGGQITLTTGDDAVHADNNVYLQGGDLQVTASYEGVEGARIYVTGGNYDVTTQDDGFNASNGESQDFGWRQTVTVSNEDLAWLQIDGGILRVHADGDGLDSNGNLIINGGDIIIDGPTNSGNGALDSGSESGGDIVIHGGTILALGSSGMAETFSANSTQAAFKVNFATNYTSGQTLTISDSSQRELVSYRVQKTGNSVVFSHPELQVGQTYTVSVGAQTQTVTQDAISVGGNTGFGGGGMNPGGGFGGNRSGEASGAARRGDRGQRQLMGSPGSVPPNQ